MTYILSIITIVTMVLAGNKSRWAWVLGLGNQGLWALYIVHTRQWGLLVMTIAITVVYARNLAKWRPSQRYESIEDELFEYEQRLDIPMRDRFFHSKATAYNKCRTCGFDLSPISSHKDCVQEELRKVFEPSPVETDTK